MNKIDLLIIDYKSSGLKRYALGLCEILKNRNPKLKIAVGYVEKDIEIKSPYIDFCLLLTEEYNLDANKIISKWKPKSILLFAHRFLEYMFTIEAHKAGIMIFNFQHGFYMDSTVISSLSLNNLIKVLRKKGANFKIYLRCLFNISDKSFFRFTQRLIDFIKFKSIYKVMNNAYGKSCNADVSFIFGNYWKEYYVKQYLEKHTAFVVVGYPELEGTNMNVPHGYFENEKLPVVCYLAQTSVEDGIIKKVDFDVFLSTLQQSLNNINLIIKLHPRSNKELYRALLDFPYSKRTKIWAETEFPLTDAYIGHESTVVARALTLTNRVLVYRLKTDRISPFERFTDYVSATSSEFNNNFIKMLESKHFSKNRDLNDFVYWNKSDGAIRETANYIYNKINR